MAPTKTVITERKTETTMADPKDEQELSLAVRAIGAIDRLDRMYQILIGFSVFLGVSLIAIGAPVFGVIWIVGGTGFVFGVQRWED